MKLRGNADLENIQQSLLRDGPFGQRAAAGGCGVLLDSRHVVVDLGLEVVGELGDVDVGVEVEAALVAGEKAEGLFCGRDEVGAACDGADGGCGSGCVFGLVVGERGDGGLLVCVGVVVFFDNGLVAGGTAGFVVGGLAGFVTSGLVLFVARPGVLFFGCFWKLLGVVEFLIARAGVLLVKRLGGCVGFARFFIARAGVLLLEYFRDFLGAIHIVLNLLVLIPLFIMNFLLTFNLLLHVIIAQPRTLHLPAQRSLYILHLFARLTSIAAISLCVAMGEIGDVIILFDDCSQDPVNSCLAFHLPHPVMVVEVIFFALGIDPGVVGRKRQVPARRERMWNSAAGFIGWGWGSRGVVGVVCPYRGKGGRGGWFGFGVLGRGSIVGRACWLVLGQRMVGVWDCHPDVQQVG